jgi:hypothetical protein
MIYLMLNYVSVSLFHGADSAVRIMFRRPRNYSVINQGRGVHVTGVSAAYTFKLNKNILSE